MVKRILAVSVAVCILLSLCGCKSILEGETSVITPYMDSQSLFPNESNAVKISSYNEFKAAVSDMVRSYSESASFSITDFDREDIENSLSQACQEITFQDPLGSFAVYYISCDVTPILTHYDVQVSIVYKRSQEDIENMITVYSERYLEYALLSAMEMYDDRCIFHTSINSITAEHVTDTIRNQYYRSPLGVVVSPTVEVASYPSGEGDRIMEVSFSYGFSDSVLVSMTDRMNKAAQEIAEHVSGSNDYDFLLALCDRLVSSSSYSPDSFSDLSNTAYGALVNKLATSEGFAMAYKALCDKMGIKCQVVNGKHMGEEHFWNIVTFSGASYHIDVTEYHPGIGILMGDETMRRDYWWDTSTVPVCGADYTYTTAEIDSPITPGNDILPLQ